MQDRQPNPDRSQLDRARRAAIGLEVYYGDLHSHIVVDEVLELQPMTEQEAEQKLLDLAENIISGEVKSHTDVARVIRRLGTKMSSIGGASAGINNAALRVEEAIIHNKFGLTDSPPAGKIKP